MPHWPWVVWRANWLEWVRGRVGGHGVLKMNKMNAHNAAAAALTVLSSPLQVRSLTSARGKGASGVLHGATSSRGITESTRVQSPLNATIVTGNAAPNMVFKKPVDFCDWHGAASSQRQETWLPAERSLLSHCLDPYTMEGPSAQLLSSLP